MKILILGATGATGVQFVEQALKAGHELTALVRTPSKLNMRDAKLKIVQGPLSDASLYLAGQDAVVSTLGHSELFSSVPILSRTLEALLSGMDTHSVGKLVYESAYGIGDTEEDLPWTFRYLIKPLLLRLAYDDHAQAEQHIRLSKIDYTIVRPTGLTNGPLTKKVSYGERLPKGGATNISRADVASFMLECLQSKELARRTVGLTSAK